MVILAKTAPLANKTKSPDFGLAKSNRLNTVTGIIVASLIIDADFHEDIITPGEYQSIYLLSFFHFLLYIDHNSTVSDDL